MECGNSIALTTKMVTKRKKVKKGIDKPKKKK